MAEEMNAQNKASEDKSSELPLRPDASVENKEASATATQAGDEPGEAQQNTQTVPEDSEADRVNPATEIEPAVSGADTKMEDEKVDEEGPVETVEGEATSVAPNGTPASSKKTQKRKSFTGVPEHKTKKLNKKKSTKEMRLNLDAQPGSLWFARMRGYPTWPAIICDEEMLPEILLKTRPVSAMRVNGTYREDFMEGGKNAADRTYPIMFLGTNEFAWHVNTALEPLDVEQIKNETSEKKSKMLWEAYQVAAQGHDLAYFKNLLSEHQNALKTELDEKASKKQSAKDKERRKSKANEDDEDMDMQEDEDEEQASKKAKASKKRKKDIDSEGEALKPVKTPKTKLKVNGPKTPAEDSASKPKAKGSKSKKKEAEAKAETDEDEDAAEKAEERPLTEAEKRETRQKAVLFLRHRLQKGFLTRDQAPKEEEMTAMSKIFDHLEQYADLEVGIIRTTKINKVLKGIIKLNSIPKDEEFQFKKRSTELLAIWNKALANDTEGPATAETDQPQASVNGVNHSDGADKTKGADPTTEGGEVKKPDAGGDGDGDVTMKDAQAETSSTKAAADKNANTEEKEEVEA